MAAKASASTMRAPIQEAIRSSLLRVAADLQEQGKLHQALTPYLDLVASHPGSDQAAIAAERVLAIAETLQAERQYHVAMMVLARLERAYEGGLDPAPAEA
jgi:hypothetical protein